MRARARRVPRGERAGGAAEELVSQQQQQQHQAEGAQRSRQKSRVFFVCEKHRGSFVSVLRALSRQRERNKAAGR